MQGPWQAGTPPVSWQPARRVAMLAGLGLLTVGAAGCQLLALPFQLLMALVTLAIKLLPLAVMFVYEPLEGAPDVQVATAREIDRLLVQAQALEDDSALPPLDLRALVRPLEHHRLVGLVLLPARDLRRGSEMQPLLTDLAARGYVVQLGPLLDGGLLLSEEDLLPRSRFLAAARQRGLVISGHGVAARLSTPEGAGLATLTGMVR